MGSQACTTKAESVGDEMRRPRSDDWSLLLRNVGKQRCTNSYTQLFMHYAPLIKRFCQSNATGSMPAEMADDLVQEVMLKVWIRAPSFDATKAGASTWVYTVMRNCRIDIFRHHQRHHVPLALIDVDEICDESSDYQPYTRLQQSRNLDLLNQFCLRLPREQRRVLQQVFMQGKSYREIAVDTGVPLGTVKSRARMGLKKLGAF